MPSSVKGDNEHTPSADCSRSSFFHDYNHRSIWASAPLVSVAGPYQMRFVQRPLPTRFLLIQPQDERQRLLNDDPYAQPHHNYGAWHQPPAQQLNAASPEDQKREQEAMHNIMRWASDQIVEIFPINSRQQQMQATNGIASVSSMNGSIVSLPQLDDADGMMRTQHQDILLSMIPGDKSKRSIRIYPASRPGTGDAQSVRSKVSQTRLNGSTRSSKAREGVFVKLNVDLP